MTWKYSGLKLKLKVGSPLITAFVGSTKETLLKGKVQYTWPPCTNLYKSAHFYIKNIIYIFNKTSYLNEEVNRTEPSPFS